MQQRPPDGEVPRDRPWARSWPAGLPWSLSYPQVSVAELVERAVRRWPSRPALRMLDPRDGSVHEEFTYAQVWARADAVAMALRSSGVRPGDRVGFVAPNGAELVSAYLGCWIAGVVAVPASDLASPSELGFRFGDAGIGLALCTQETETSVSSVAQPLGIPVALLEADGCSFVSSPQRRADTTEVPPELALLLYTGGTTGEPKAAMLSHANLVTNTVQFATWYGFEQAAEVCIGVLPMTHSGGMSGSMLVPLATGGTIIGFPRFSPQRTVEAIERYGATRFFGVPTMYAAICNRDSCAGYDLSSLRACRSGAAPLPAELKRRFDALVGRPTLVEAYGLTETSPLVAANPPEAARPGSIGLPLPDTDVAISRPADGQSTEGELSVRGPQVMLGYWQRPEATADVLDAQGWLRTGDVARIDEDGYLTIVDRLKDVIIRGGYKVWPRHVEEVLFEHPAVGLAGVVGVPDDYAGETVCATVQLRPGTRTDVDELRAHCEARLARYEVPERIEIRDELPTSPAGKILRRTLREQAVAVTGTGASRSSG